MKANVNPFRSRRVEQIRYALPEACLDAIADDALQQRCSCLLGPKGTGKTTLLEDLEPRLQARGHTTQWIRLHLDSPRADRRAATQLLNQLPRHAICLFDGAEILNQLQWLQVRRAARKRGFHLIATLHKPRGVPILRHTSPSWSLAEKFVRQLAGAHSSEELVNHAKDSFDLNHGNMREVFRSCYLSLAK